MAVVQKGIGIYYVPPSTGLAIHSAGIYGAPSVTGLVAGAEDQNKVLAAMGHTLG